MNLGYFSYPLPANEPVLQYAPESAERKALKKVLKELKSSEADIPMYINGQVAADSSKIKRRNSQHKSFKRTPLHAVMHAGTRDRLLLIYLT